MLNVRLTSSTTPVKAKVPTAHDLPTTPAPTTTPIPVDDLDSCLDCGGYLDTLIGDDGEIRAVFCPYCDL